MGHRGPYLRFFIRLGAVYFVGTIAANVVRTYKPAWSSWATLAEVVLAVVLILFAYRRLHQSGFFRSFRENINQIADMIVEEEEARRSATADNTEDDEDEDETRRLRRNARARERYAQRRARQQRQEQAQKEWLTEKLADRVSPTPDPKESGPARTKWDHLLEDDDLDDPV